MGPNIPGEFKMYMTQVRSKKRATDKSDETSRDVLTDNTLIRSEHRQSTDNNCEHLFDRLAICTLRISCVAGAGACVRRSRPRLFRTYLHARIPTYVSVYSLYIQRNNGPTVAGVPFPTHAVPLRACVRDGVGTSVGTYVSPSVPPSRARRRRRSGPTDATAGRAGRRAGRRGRRYDRRDGLINQSIIGSYR